MAGGVHTILLKTRNYGYLCTCVDVSMTLFQCDKIEILFHLQDNIGTRNQRMQSIFVNAPMIYHKHKLVWTLEKFAEEFPAKRNLLSKSWVEFMYSAASQYKVQAHTISSLRCLHNPLFDHSQTQSWWKSIYRHFKYLRSHLQME